jgi:hypothetical protein
MRQRPDLIVPVKDRRQHKRYLTLKNLAIAAAVAFALFVVVTVLSEYRRPAANDYGRIVKGEISAKPVEPRPMDVVREDAPAIDDQAYADPTLVTPMARQQWLGNDTQSVAAMQPAPSTTTVREDAVALDETSGEQKKKRPLLTGGFGRKVEPSEPAATPPSS